MTATEERKEREKQVAETTFSQLGGGRAMAMLGGTASRDGSTLIVRVRAGRKVSAFTVAYDFGLDLYNLRFLRIRKFKVETVAEFTGIYSDQLRAIVEEQTGCFLSL